MAILSFSPEHQWLTAGLQTFMSMGLFNWQPEEGETVMSRYWWIYFAVTGGLTLIVFLVYFFWSRLTDAWSHWREKSDREMV